MPRWVWVRIGFTPDCVPPSVRRSAFWLKFSCNSVPWDLVAKVPGPLWNQLLLWDLTICRWSLPFWFYALSGTTTTRATCKTWEDWGVSGFEFAVLFLLCPKAIFNVEFLRFRIEIAFSPKWYPDSLHRCGDFRHEKFPMADAFLVTNAAAASSVPTGARGTAAPLHTRRAALEYSSPWNVRPSLIIHGLPILSSLSEQGRTNVSPVTWSKIQDLLLGSCLPSFTVLLLPWERIYLKEGFYLTFNGECYWLNQVDQNK